MNDDTNTHTTTCAVPLANPPTAGSNSSSKAMSSTISNPSNKMAAYQLMMGERMKRFSEDSWSTNDNNTKRRRSFKHSNHISMSRTPPKSSLVVVEGEIDAFGNTDDCVASFTQNNIETRANKNNNVEHDGDSNCTNESRRHEEDREDNGEDGPGNSKATETETGKQSSRSQRIQRVRTTAPAPSTKNQASTIIGTDTANGQQQSPAKASSISAPVTKSPPAVRPPQPLWTEPAKEQKQASNAEQKPAGKTNGNSSATTDSPPVAHRSQRQIKQEYHDEEEQQPSTKASNDDKPDSKQQQIIEKTNGDSAATKSLPAARQSQRGGKQTNHEEEQHPSTKASIGTKAGSMQQQQQSTGKNNGDSASATKSPPAARRSQRGEKQKTHEGEHRPSTKSGSDHKAGNQHHQQSIGKTDGCNSLDSKSPPAPRSLRRKKPENYEEKQRTLTKNTTATTTSTNSGMKSPATRLSQRRRGSQKNHDEKHPPSNIKGSKRAVVDKQQDNFGNNNKATTPRRPRQRRKQENCEKEQEFSLTNNDSFVHKNSNTATVVPEEKIECLLSKIDVDTSLSILWSDGKFYDGTVTYKTREGDAYQFYVEYSDGDQSWHNLKQEIFYFTEPAPKVPNGKIDVGAVLSVLWDDDKYYKGTITEIRDSDGHVFVEYQDGDAEWHNLQEATFYFDQQGSSNDENRNKINVGTVLSILWTDNEFYEGVVKKIRDADNVFVEYGDSDKVWHNLKEETFYFEQQAPSTATTNTANDSPTEQVPDKKKICLGTVLAIKWDDSRFYEGVVTKKKKDPDNVFVEYGDGDKFWHRLKNETYFDVTTEASPFSSTADYEGVRLGSHISLSWGDVAKYDGIVTKTCPNKNYFVFVEYYDGQKVWHNLKTERFEVIDVDDEEVITTLAIQWSDGRYYEGILTTTRQTSNNELCYIEYSDGDKVWHDLSREKYFVVSSDDGASVPSNESYHGVNLNSRLSVHWANGEALGGTVTKIQPGNNYLAFIEYYDGQKAWHDLRWERFDLIYPVGTKVYKNFGKHGYFWGTIVESQHHEELGIGYKIKYSDGDLEVIADDADNSTKLLKELDVAVEAAAERARLSNS